jgi:hypothetical protein
MQKSWANTKNNEWWWWLVRRFFSFIPIPFLVFYSFVYIFFYNHRIKFILTDSTALTHSCFATVLYTVH